MKTVLVTGVGAVIGYGILRELRETKPDIRLVACDTSPDAVGQHWSDTFRVAPPVLDERYSSFITELVNHFSVDLILPGFEQDVTWLNENRQLFSGHTTLGLNSEHLIRLTYDKWKFAEHLLTTLNDVRIPTFLDLGFDSLVREVGVPFVAKPRVSYASKGLRIIRSVEDYLRITAESREGYLFQPVVGSDDREVTVSVFSDGSGSVLAEISLRRLLSAEGSSWKVWSFDDSSLKQVVESLVSIYRPIGSTNLQFRQCDDRWYLLEINPRISSAIGFRNGFGYREATMSVDLFLDSMKPTQPILRQGTATRYLSEVFNLLN